jgi:DNA-binding transcriptional LysR family regulator
MDALINLRTFLAVARCSGFSEAARGLHVVPSVVVKRITQLEAVLKTRLFERTTRKVSLTDSGRRLHARVRPLVSEMDDLLHDVRRDEGKLEGHIRLMAPTTLTLLRLGPILDAFLAEHDRITLEIALVDRSTNPIEAGFDMAISGRSASYEGVVDVPLCPVRPQLCASPSYFHQRSRPSHPRDLAEHNCLVFKPAGDTWEFQSNRGLVHVEVFGRLTADDNHTLLQCARNGRGIAILPDYVCRDALNAGELETLLPAYPPQDAWFKAYVPRRRHGAARIRALLDWLLSRLEEVAIPA